MLHQLPSLTAQRHGWISQVCAAVMLIMLDVWGFRQRLFSRVSTMAKWVLRWSWWIGCGSLSAVWEENIRQQTRDNPSLPRTHCSWHFHTQETPPPLVMNMTVLLFFIFYDLGYETPQSGDPLFYKYSAEETCGRILWTISSIFNNLCCHKISVCACVSALFAWMKKCEEVCCTDCMCCFFGLSSCFSSQLFS